MALKTQNTYRDSRGNEWLIQDMKTAKLANCYRSTLKKHKALKDAINCKGFANSAQERRLKELELTRASLKAELVIRNPFNLEGILNGF
ncbi:hypothetical protein [Vibrio phage vB_ValS_PJ32]|nr:hypothetical protein [Vibrio phage vB_ValS_PJ32]